MDTEGQLGPRSLGRAVVGPALPRPPDGDRLIRRSDWSLAPAASRAVLAAEEAPKRRRHEFRLAPVVGRGVPDSRKHDASRTRQHSGESIDRCLEALVAPLSSEKEHLATEGCESLERSGRLGHGDGVVVDGRDEVQRVDDTGRRWFACSSTDSKTDPLLEQDAGHEPERSPVGSSLQDRDERSCEVSSCQLTLVARHPRALGRLLGLERGS